jgi:valyl-tRNA synthetase
MDTPTTDITRDASQADTSAGQAGDMPKVYVPSEVEPDIQARWLAADVFAPDGSGSRALPDRDPFVVIMPPPNVTGALHLGHAARSSTEDLMVRRARMQRRPTLWLPGVDHASIAAQWVLRRVLADEGTTPEQLGRERYLERMWRFMDETRPVIDGQQKRVGASADWGRERFTMDQGSAQAVRTAFKRLYDDGLAYRGEKLINWCPGCMTSLSDLEVIGTPETGSLWFVRYHLLDGSGAPSPDETITVATTRPETILGDTGVAVHPDDERYSGLVGRLVRIPFVDRDVPLIADAMVEREFGTGAVKITPAHDHADFETGGRHGLSHIDVMTDDGHMNEAAGEFAGLGREETRQRIVAALEAHGDLVEVRAHEMVIGRCQRSSDIVEPRLKTQWFIDVKPMAERAMASVREGRTRILPARFEKVFFDWLENIHDWNVSRQLWWGHRIPAWYCPDGHVTVSDAPDGPGACDACGRDELRQEEDILDTWFSSGLWPFSTLGWPEETDDLARFYPTTVMETGYDILFFWVARMMMLGEWLTGREPFAVVYLSGLVRDPYGRKMSKTTGNVIDPLGVMDEIGADALRYALVNGAAPGADQRLGPSRLEGARNFANKIWNAARYVTGARPVEIAPDAALELPDRSLLGPAEHWILSRCEAAIREVDAAYEQFQFGEATRLLHAAIWSEYCDWYLELAKVRMGSDVSAELRAATWRVLAWVLDRYLRLLHPVMPHLTEAIWARLPHRPGDAGLLIVADWPEPGLAQPDEDRAAGVTDVLDLVSAMRNARTDAGIQPSSWLEARLRFTEPRAESAYAELAGAVSRLARVRPVVQTPGHADGEADHALFVVTRAAEARLVAESADRDRDRARLEREIAEVERLLAAARERLADERFTSRAPEAVVAGARDRAAELEERLARLRER